MSDGLYRPLNRVEDGTRVEDLIYSTLEVVAKVYHAKTGIDAWSWFSENGGNAAGFDGYYKSDKRPELVAIEMKNLDTYYTIGESWLKHTLYNKEEANGLEVDCIFAIMAGGNFNHESMQMMLTDPRTKLRQITTRKITCDEELKDEKLVKNVRAVCWEILEFMFGELKDVYFLCTGFIDNDGVNSVKTGLSHSTVPTSLTGDPPNLCRFSY